jgi:hypothetical protein
MDDKLTVALIGVVGIAIGVVVRDVVMSLVLMRKKRVEEIDDRTESRARSHRELVRHYADPLFQTVQSLRSRLDEIINGSQANYLVANSPKNNFVEYKRISTFYRFAALLGWIRAFRRERSYLDPQQEMDQADTFIDNIASALADGQHVEELRLDELANLWRIPGDLVADKRLRASLASEIDGILQAFVDDRSILSAADLDLTKRQEVVRKCADAIRGACRVDIPSGLVDASVVQASTILGIREAYIYRDWQSAIGDMMIVELSGGVRRFEVLGFAAFEEKYHRSRNLTSDNYERRWFDRIEILFHDLDMKMSGIFDARRGQLKSLYKGLLELEAYLKSKRTNLAVVPPR